MITIENFSNILSFQRIKIFKYFITTLKQFYFTFFFLKAVLNTDKSIKQKKQYDITLGIKITNSNMLHIHSLAFIFLYSLSISYSSN